MKSNYALGLVVGVKNQFTKGAKQIQEEYKKLSTEHNKLQTRVKDVDAYKQAQTELKSYKEELKQMSNPTEAAEAKLRQLTNALSRQSRALKKAGIDTNDLADAQNKLQKELQQTASKMNSVNNTDMFNAESLAGIGVGAGTLAASAQSGLNTNQAERQAAASTRIELETIQSWRNALADIETQTARPYQEILNTRIQASKSGYDDKTALELTKTSAQLSSVFADLNWDPKDIIAAQVRVMKSLDLSASEAADFIAITAQKSGDDKGDLLDTISEYSSTYADQGLDAETIFAQLIAGRQAGAFNYDQIGDQLKETLQARLSDPDEFKKLVGTGDKQGSIDELIKSPELAKSFKEAVFNMRNAMNSGENVGSAYGDMMMQLASLYQTDKGAARNMAEGIGGVRLAEDIGSRGIEGIAKAAQDPQSILGEYTGTLAEAMEVAISPTQKLMAEIGAMGRAASTSITELENLSEGILGFIRESASTVRNTANDNSLVAGALTLGAGAASAYGAAKGAGFIKDKVLGLLAGGIKDKKSKSESSSNIGKFASVTDSPDKSNHLRPKASKFSLIKDNVLGLLAGGIKDKKSNPESSSIIGKFASMTDSPDKNNHQRPNTSRLSGKFSLNGLGKVFKPLAWLTSAAPMIKAASDGNYKDAGKTAASLGGGIAGMKLGALAGGLGGPIGIAVGGVAGGVLGSIFGEKAIDSIMERFAPGAEQEIDSVSKETQELEQAVAASTHIESTVSVEISAPVTIESGAIVPEDFQEQLINTFRNLTPELTVQLQETLDSLAAK
ncbi:phage tail tape measure protein [Vibrio scophthalmi]|uniref:phage tail tape measure protein n=1 Tax=Vibrio scophthalmi TaxID=45658 RepID=UPI00349F6C8C